MLPGRSKEYWRPKASSAVAGREGGNVVMVLGLEVPVAVGKGTNYVKFIVSQQNCCVMPKFTFMTNQKSYQENYSTHVTARDFVE